MNYGVRQILLCKVKRKQVVLFKYGTGIYVFVIQVNSCHIMTAIKQFRHQMAADEAIRTGDYNLLPCH